MAADDILNTIRNHQVTILIGVPKLYAAIRKGVMDKINASIIAKSIFAIASAVNSYAFSKFIFIFASWTLFTLLNYTLWIFAPLYGFFLCIARCAFFYTDTRPDKPADLSVKCYAGGRVRDGEWSFRHVCPAFQFGGTAARRKGHTAHGSFNQWTYLILTFSNKIKPS